MGMRNQASTTCAGVAGSAPVRGVGPRGPRADEEWALGYVRLRGDRGIQIFGNTQGLKASQVRALERLYRRRLPAGRLITQEFARELTEISQRDRPRGGCPRRSARCRHARHGGQPVRDRDARVGAPARRPGPPARPPLRPHLPRRRAADPRRPDRPRQAPPRRDGDARDGRVRRADGRARRAPASRQAGRHRGRAHAAASAGAARPRLRGLDRRARRGARPYHAHPHDRRGRSRRSWWR